MTRRLVMASMAAALAAASLLGPGRAGASDPRGWRTALAVPSAYVQDATFASPDVAWAVGFGGIFRSADGGRSWDTVSTPAEFGGFTSVAAAPDGKHGWAVGGLGLIEYTADGGITWTRSGSIPGAITSPGTQNPAGINLVSVAAIDDDSAIAVGIDRGYSDVISHGPKAHIVVRTDDGGVTWRELHIDPDYELSSNDFAADGKHGWMSGSRCVPVTDPNAGFGCSSTEYATFRSDDAGETWHLVNTTSAVTALSFVDANTGWAVARPCGPPETCGSSVARTTDGGKTWTDVHATTGADRIATVTGTSASAAYALEIAGQGTVRLLVTRDAGASWQTVTEEPRGGLALAWNGGNGVWLGPDAQRWTADGMNWHDASFPVTVGSGAFDLVDAQHGWFAASKLLRTTDGGATWTPVSEEQLASVDFASASEGWGARFPCSAAGCETATVVHTTDGGATWTQQGQFASGNRPVVTFVDRRNGWFYSQSDTKVMHTRDGGATWYEQHLPFPAAPAAVWTLQFIDSHAVAVSAAVCGLDYADCAQHVYVSTNGGDAWTERGTFPGGGNCRSNEAAASDGMHIWVVTVRCDMATTETLHATDDGGRTWRSFEMAPTQQFTGLRFFTSEIGRGVRRTCGTESCSSELVRTSDGGATWTSEPLPVAIAQSSIGPDGVRFVSPEHLFVMTHAGGGIFIVTQQRLWAFAGVEPALDIPTITMPDTGSGAPRARSDGRIGAVALGVFGVMLAFVGLRRRRAVSG